MADPDEGKQLPGTAYRLKRKLGAGGMGTVWIAVHDVVSGTGRARRFEYPGPRDIIRDRSAKTALQLARWALRREDAPILWERA